MRIDSARTSLTGHSEELLFGKYGGGITRFQTAFERQSAGYELNDLGYLQRADHMVCATWASLVWNKPRAFYNRPAIDVAPSTKAKPPLPAKPPRPSESSADVAGNETARVRMAMGVPRRIFARMIGLWLFRLMIESMS